jgi:hypothetical protein
MKKSELESILKRARLPEVSEQSFEMFPRRIVARLKSNDSPVGATRQRSFRLAWALGMVACVVLAFAVGRWTGRKEPGTILVPDSLAGLKLIRETLAKFPNRVRAIVEDEHGLSLILSDKVDVPVSTPIYVRIWDGKHYSSLVTFSGQEVQIAGQKVTVLSQGDGGIILEGNKLFWASGKPVYAERNLKIEARNLGPNSM